MGVVGALVRVVVLAVVGVGRGLVIHSKQFAAVVVVRVLVAAAARTCRGGSCGSCGVAALAVAALLRVVCGVVEVISTSSWNSKTPRRVRSLSSLTPRMQNSTLIRSLRAARGSGIRRGGNARRRQAASGAWPTTVGARACRRRKRAASHARLGTQGTPDSWLLFFVSVACKQQFLVITFANVPGYCSLLFFVLLIV